MKSTFRAAALALTFAFVAGLSLSTTVVKPKPGSTTSSSIPSCDPNRGCGIYR